MATEVIMPQMGESIAEGTVTKWLKQVGERIERDEPLLEISTDKVDTVIPSPAAGTITEIKVPEGETVPIQTVIAILDGPAGGTATAGEAAAPEPASSPGPSSSAPLEPPPALAPPPLPTPPSPAPPALAPPPLPTPPSPAPPALEPPPPPTPVLAPQPVATETAVTAIADGGNGTALSPTHPVSGRVLTSPLVKRIAREEKIDLRAVPGTGMGGRVTRSDILKFVGDVKSGVTPAALPPAAGTYAPGAPLLGGSAPNPAWQAQVMEGDQVEKMSNMRRLIAEHMVYSKRTSPHVYTMFEFDMTNIAEIRRREKENFLKQAGVKLTYMPFVAKAVCHALQRNPLVNASVQGDHVVRHRHVNLAIAVALEKGLIVPVVKRAEEKSFLGLARSLADIAHRARNKQLTPDDVSGGTFTITNPGVFGSLIGFAVINQPQVGILDMGGIVKRPVVIEAPDGTDAIGIRHMQLISISYDHRVVDGATADHFMNDLRDYLREWNQPLL